jgi:hypothetical protein
MRQLALGGEDVRVVRRGEESDRNLSTRPGQCGSLIFAAQFHPG